MWSNPLCSTCACGPGDTGLGRQIVAWCHQHLAKQCQECFLTNSSYWEAPTVLGFQTGSFQTGVYPLGQTEGSQGLLVACFSRPSLIEPGLPSVLFLIPRHPPQRGLLFSTNPLSPFIPLSPSLFVVLLASKQNLIFDIVVQLHSDTLEKMFSQKPGLK